MYNSILVALSSYYTLPLSLGNMLIRHTFGCHKSGKWLEHFRYALSNGKVTIVYKGRKTDFNRTFSPNRRNGVPMFDVSSSKSPIPNKVLFYSMFTANLFVYVWYSRDKTVPL